ncbi:hypothetical protein Hanom_Chr04g00291871 [Helianthus anomalus]
MNHSLAVVEHIRADLCDVRSVRHSFRAAIHEAGPRIKYAVFLKLSSTLEPGRPATTDKVAILGDVVCVLHQHKSESQDFKEMNEKISEEIKTLMAEKNKLRE